MKPKKFSLIIALAFISLFFAKSVRADSGSITVNIPVGFTNGSVSVRINGTNANGSSMFGTVIYNLSSAVTPVNGVCGSDNNQSFYSLSNGSAGACSAGSEANFFTTGGNNPGWTWNCNGTGGGSNASCSANKKVDGVCSTTLNTCVYGTFLDTADGTCTNNWTCSGINSGNSAVCSTNKSVGTSCPGGSCNSSGVCIIGACTNGSIQACGTGVCTGTQTCTAGVWGSCSTSGNTCTAATQCTNAALCTSAGTCPAVTNKSNGTVCDDSNVCTSPDTCTSGVCSGPNTCNVPDLVTQSLTVTGTLVAGNTLSFSATVRNSGLASAGAVSQTRLRIDRDRNSTWDVNPANQSTSNLIASATETETWGSAWTNIPAGNHRIEVCADVTNTVAESNESNCSTYDFVVSSVSCTTVTYNPSTSGFSTNQSATAPYASSLAVATNSIFYAFVDYGVAGIDSIISPNVAGSYTCVFEAYVGSIARFMCTSPVSGGNYVYTTGTNAATASNTCASGPTTIGTITVPPPPTNPVGTCPSPYTSASLSWTAPGGYNNFYVRLKLGANNYTWPPDIQTEVTGTTWNPPTTPGQSYTWWVSTKAANGAWSQDLVSYNLSCTSAPAITLSPTTMTFSGTSGGSAPTAQTFTVRNSGSAGSTLKWRATTNQSWCFVNGVGNGTYFNGADLSAGATSPNLSVTMSAPSNAGSFSCTVTVSDNGSSPAASNSPQTLTATYTVKPSNVSSVTASLAVCPSRVVTISWTAASSGATAKTYTIYRSTTNNSATATAIASNVVATTYADSPTTGSTYYYWVETVSGGQVSPNRVASVPASLNVAACATPPNNPPGGGGSDPCVENGTNICGNSLAVVCDTVGMTWSDNSSDETGFYVYIDSDSNIGNGYIQRYTTAVNATSYTVTPPNNNPYYYFVSAFNGGGETAIIAADDNPVAAQDCSSNLTTSDKDIVAINGNNIGTGLGNQCSGTDALPVGTQLDLGDKVKFSINLCNSGTAEASGITITDRLTNLVMPTAGWNAKYDSGSGEVSIASVGITLAVSGTAPNQIITFSNVPNVPTPGPTPPAIRRITFEAQLSVPANFSATSARFQNSFSVAYNAGIVNKNTPLILFFTGQGVPIIIEVP